MVWDFGAQPRLLQAPFSHIPEFRIQNSCPPEHLLRWKQQFAPETILSFSRSVPFHGNTGKASSSSLENL